MLSLLCTKYNNLKSPMIKLYLFRFYYTDFVSRVLIKVLFVRTRTETCLLKIGFYLKLLVKNDNVKDKNLYVK